MYISNSCTSSRVGLAGGKHTEHIHFSTRRIIVPTSSKAFFNKASRFGKINTDKKLLLASFMSVLIVSKERHISSITSLSSRIADFVIFNSETDVTISDAC